MRNTNRKLRYFFKRADAIMWICRTNMTSLPTFRCGYDGKVYEVGNNSQAVLADYILDFPEFRELMGSKSIDV
jgi:hypothetical protein